ncbi:DUF4974 domain-containing protein [Flagellimonas sp. HMM57]|uniref:FecR family protein n=1 Tax=unclassified Flagellimonas TaxID=2644544 RepID=UPI0013D03C23|nr:MULTISPECIES: FecR family protein [unclassified Flagellimonas]UII76192.1 DUF4974 domain-containing protein [Flagellimonas sp. HMM57]
MESVKLKELFEKYLKRECSKEEIQQIVAYFRTSEDLSDVPTIDAVSELLEKFPDMDDVEADQMYLEILQSAHKKKNTFSFKKVAGVAAIFIGLFATGFLYLRGDFISDDEFNLIPADEAITLQLDNGNVEVIKNDGSVQVVDPKGNIVGQQSGNQLVYSNEVVVEKLVYNTLTIPYGKRFDLVLSDGTKVTLNSGTSLKYPIKFLPNHKREVFLSGEAFFDVEEDKEHPFVVNANELDVTVLGTQFVVSLYEEDKTTAVVLVEGSVDLSKGTDTDTTRLTPGTRGVLDERTGLVSKTNVNISFYTAWMQGVLVFRNETFENISKKLERVYNVSIISENPDFDKEVFNASFDNETIEDILSYFKDSYDMNYIIENNTIYIK